MNEGEDITINCPIIGNPELTFTWYQLKLDKLTGDVIEKIIQPEITSEKVFFLYIHIFF